MNYVISFCFISEKIIYGVHELYLARPCPKDLHGRGLNGIHRVCLPNNMYNLLKFSLHYFTSQMENHLNKYLRDKSLTQDSHVFFFIIMRCDLTGFWNLFFKKYMLNENERLHGSFCIFIFFPWKQ
ncbi:hypothetical protein ACJX0J_039202, partial [Zea mays]